MNRVGGSVVAAATLAFAGASFKRALIAMLGAAKHHDLQHLDVERRGPRDAGTSRSARRRERANASWNAVHLSSGCSQANLVQTGGAGLFYCFAVN